MTLEERQAEWKARWPNHCTQCTGTFEFNDDDCSGMERGQCHRCGEKNARKRNQGMCKFCTWCGSFPGDSLWVE